MRAWCKAHNISEKKLRVFLDNLICEIDNNLDELFELMKKVRCGYANWRDLAVSATRGIFFLLLIAYQVMGLHMLAEKVGTPSYTLLIWLLSILSTQLWVSLPYLLFTL